MLSMLLILAAGTQNAVRPLTAAERVVIERSVKEQLNDPDSATFRHSAYHIGSQYYCGRVNAKNRFGGYVGYRVFSLNVQGGKGGARPAEGSYGTATIVGSVRGSSVDQLMSSLVEARCQSEGYLALP